MRFPVLFLVCALAPLARADEGLWPYNQFPAATVQKRGVEADTAFLDRIRLASVKLGNGSAGFVSPNGLLLTSRQVAGACLQATSSAQRDYFHEGFQAPNEAGELKCPGLDASVLLKIETVTEQVAAGGQSLAQRNAAIARVEKDCAAKSGDVCAVVRLFSGGRYDLYHYKRYSDIRLVFAPEFDIAFFGRERDSVTYLRYGLNIAFLRVYENGRPASTPNYLKWSADGVRDGDLVFLAGNPGPTGRLSTAAQLAFYRDTALPVSVTRLQPRVVQLNAFAATNVENMRAAQSLLSDAADAIQIRSRPPDRLARRPPGSAQDHFRRQDTANGRGKRQTGRGSRKGMGRGCRGLQEMGAVGKVVRDSGRRAGDRLAPVPHRARRSCAANPSTIPAIPSTTPSKP